MEAVDGPRDADPHAQERADLHRCAGAAPVAIKPEPANGPSRIELGRQRVLVLETRQSCGRNVLARRSHNEHTGSDPVRRAGMRGSVQDELAILMERLERAVRKLDHSAAPDPPRYGRCALTPTVPRRPTGKEGTIGATRPVDPTSVDCAIRASSSSPS